MSRLDEPFINGSDCASPPAQHQYRFAYQEPESLLMGVNDIAVSLVSLHFSDAGTELRMSGFGRRWWRIPRFVRLGRFNLEEEEVDYVANRVVETVQRLRGFRRCTKWRKRNWT